jgi:hypothetical protein
MPPFNHLPPDGFVPMLEAVQRLGKSDRTIRRMIQRGELEGEPIARPQGTVWYVKLPSDLAAETAQDAAPGGEAASNQENEAPGTLAAVAALDAALRRAEERAAALDERNERQAAIVVAQAERIGRVESERDQLRAELAAERARRPWWRLW